MKEIINEVNRRFQKNFNVEDFVPVYNQDNENIEFVCVWDDGVAIIRQSPSGRICLIEANFLSGKCTIL